MERFALTQQQQGSAFSLENSQSSEEPHNQQQQLDYIMDMKKRLHSLLSELDHTKSSPSTLASPQQVSSIASPCSSLLPPPPLPLPPSSSNSINTYQTTSTPSSKVVASGVHGDDSVKYSTPRSSQSVTSSLHSLPTPPLFSKPMKTIAPPGSTSSTSSTPPVSSQKKNNPLPFQPPKMVRKSLSENISNDNGKSSFGGKVTPLKSPALLSSSLSSQKRSSSTAGKVSRTPLANITNHVRNHRSTPSPSSACTFTTPTSMGKTTQTNKTTTPSNVAVGTTTSTPKPNHGIVLEKASSLEHLKLSSNRQKTAVTLKASVGKKSMSSQHCSPSTTITTTTTTTKVEVVAPSSQTLHQLLKPSDASSLKKPETNSLDFNMTVGSISPIKNRDNKDMTLLFPESHNIQQILSSLDHVNTDDLFPKLQEIKTSDDDTLYDTTAKSRNDEECDKLTDPKSEFQLQQPTMTAQRYDDSEKTKNPAVKRKRFDSIESECESDSSQKITDGVEQPSKKVLLNKDNKESVTRVTKASKKVTIKETIEPLIDDDHDDEEEHDHTSDDSEKKSKTTFKPKLTLRREKKSKRVFKIYDNALLLEKSEFALNAPSESTNHVMSTEKSRDKFTLAREYIKEANTALKKEGNISNALELYEKALQLIPSNEKLKQKITKLKQLDKDRNRTVQQNDVLTINTTSASDEEEEFQLNHLDVEDVEMSDAVAPPPPLLQEEGIFKPCVTNNIRSQTTSSEGDNDSWEKSTQAKLLDYLNDTNNGMKQLKKLATIGDKKAEKIMECRPFKTISELSKIGLGEKGIATLIEKNEKLISELDE